MALEVFSEIGRLREVVVHSPGLEVDNMPPDMMREWLFDDILFGPRSRQEHSHFRQIMSYLGVEVLEFQVLLEEALSSADDVIPAMLRDLGNWEGMGPAVMEYLAQCSPVDLAQALIQGVRRPPNAEGHSGDSYGGMALAPSPNLMFTRDPQFVLGNEMVISGMHGSVRRREAFLSRFVFRHHPERRQERLLLDFSKRWANPHYSLRAMPSIEGGDVLVFNEGCVLIGVSQRTMERGADLLVESLRGLPHFRWAILVPLPEVRHAMHLDTIFTRISQSECLVYAPMVLPDRLNTVSVLKIDLHKPDDLGVRERSLLQALKGIGIDLEPICCGGTDHFAQQAREQWTDGANSLAIAPGVICLYERNEATAEELAKKGYEIIRVRELDFESQAMTQFEWREGRKVAILIESGELSRARGGPRCMTAPLVREPV